MPNCSPGGAPFDVDVCKQLAFQEISHGMAVERLRALLTPDGDPADATGAHVLPRGLRQPFPAPRSRMYVASSSSDVYSFPIRILPTADIEVEGDRLRTLPPGSRHLDGEEVPRPTQCDLPELRRLARENNDLKFRIKVLTEKMEEVVHENDFISEEVKHILELSCRMATCAPLERSAGVVPSPSMKSLISEKSVQTMEDFSRVETEKAEAVNKVCEAIKTAQDAEARWRDVKRELDSARLTIEDLKTKATFSAEIHSRLASVSAELRDERRNRLDLEVKLDQSVSKCEEIRASSERLEQELRKEVSKLIETKVHLESQLETLSYDASRAQRDLEAKVSRQQVEMNALRDRAERFNHHWRMERDKGLSFAQALSDCRQQVEILQRYQPRMESNESSDCKEIELQKQKLFAFMEAKNYETTAELEKLVAKQADILRRLKEECQVLTKRLDDAHKNYKHETSRLNEENDILTSRLRDITSLWDSMQSETDLQARIQRLSGVVGELKAGLKANSAEVVEDQ